MSRKRFLTIVGVLMVTTLLSLFPMAGYAQESTGGNFILVNYIGQALTLDLDDVTYTVPGTDTSPEGGRFELQLAPGEHKYAVNVPQVTGSAGEFTIEPGGTVAKGVRLEKGNPAVDRNGIVLEKPQDEVVLFDFDPFAVAPTEVATPVDSWQPVAPMPGKGSIVWINHSGQDELTVDLAGQLYKVAPKMNDIPGRLQADVSPGTYSYTASVPYGSLNGEISVVAGNVTGINIIPGIREEPEYEVGEKVEFPPVELSLFEEDLTGQVGIVQSTSAQDSSPTATDEEMAPANEEGVAIPAVSEGLLVKNYTGDTLIFTIDNRAFAIPDRAEQTIVLPAGSYNYTASLPFVATTGTVDLVDGQGIELSVAINVARDFLSVYQN
jgi:hypothetical protein